MIEILVGLFCGSLVLLWLSHQRRKTEESLNNAINFIKLVHLEQSDMEYDHGYLDASNGRRHRRERGRPDYPKPRLLK